MDVLLPDRVSAETSDETAQEMARAPVVPGPRSLPVRPRKTDRKRSTRIAPRTEVSLLPIHGVHIRVVRVRTPCPPYFMRRSSTCFDNA